MPDSSPSNATVIISYIGVVVAGVAAAAIYVVSDPQPLLIDTSGFSVFAPLYIAAQAIERFLEPAAALWNNTTAQKLELKKANAHKARLEGLPDGDPQKTLANLETGDSEVAARELALAKVKSARAIPLWPIASALALIVCAILGLGLIEAVAQARPTSEFIRTADVLLTGLAVGAGTKPLHDLISR